MSIETRYQVKGMTCGGCAKKLRKHLDELPGLVSVDIPVPREGLVTITTESEIDHDAVQAAVERAGYTFEGQPAAS